MMVERQQAAQNAEQLLQNDVDAIDDFNNQVKTDNRRVTDVLTAILGTAPGDSPKDLAALVRQSQGRVSDPDATPRPTVVDNVPIPNPIQSGPTIATTSFDTFHNEGPHTFHTDWLSCFGAGTLVRTLNGPRRLRRSRSATAC